MTSSGTPVLPLTVPHILPLIFLVALLFTGCLDEETSGSECKPEPLFASCARSRPSSAELTIRVGGGGLQQVNVYAGAAYETGRLVWSGTSGGRVRLPFGPYSATARYFVDGKTVIAVDGDDLDYSATEYCEGTCYEELGGEVDLRLEN